jgi:transposase-like protein
VHHGISNWQSLTQHFLLSAAARGLSLAAVARLSEEQAFETLKGIRWADNNGEPYCPSCGCVGIYALVTRKLWKCKGCCHQFSVTSSTIFADRKLSIRNYLFAIALFVNSSKGHSALQLSRELNVQYRSAFVLLHKLREALSNVVDKIVLSGRVEIDGAYFGGYVKPANYKKRRRDRRNASIATGKQRVVVVVRQRHGNTTTIVSLSEMASVPQVRDRLEPGSIVYADDAPGWNALHADFDTRRINHSECYSDGKACTNQAESFFSRLRRAEVGTHHQISKFLPAYAAEMAWRENTSRISSLERYKIVISLALNHPVSSRWRGYWQRRKSELKPPIPALAALAAV